MEDCDYFVLKDRNSSKMGFVLIFAIENLILQYIRIVIVDAIAIEIVQLVAGVNGPLHLYFIQKIKHRFH